MPYPDLCCVGPRPELLLGPFEIVSSWLDPSNILDKKLEPLPERNGFERTIEPAGGDAKVRLVWRNVVDPVVAPRKYYVHVLK